MAVYWLLIPRPLQKNAMIAGMCNAGPGRGNFRAEKSVPGRARETIFGTRSVLVCDDLFLLEAQDLLLEEEAPLLL